jgi:hypothetical protein
VNAKSRSSFPARALIIRIGRLWPVSRTCRTTSYPLITSIFASSTVAAGRSLPISSSASWPFDAVLTS